MATFGSPFSLHETRCNPVFASWLLSQAGLFETIANSFQRRKALLSVIKAPFTLSLYRITGLLFRE